MTGRLKLLVLFGVSTPSWACETPTLDALPAVFDEQSDDFVVERKKAHAELRCLTSPISVEVVADLHRIEALSHVVADNYSLALQALAAAQAIDPAWRFPKKFENGPTRGLHEEALQMPDPGHIELDAIEGWTAWVDGSPAQSRPVDRPFVFQWVGPTVQTRYLGANAAVPPPPTSLPRTRSNGRLWLASGIGLAAVTTGGIGLWERRRLLTADAPDCPCPAFEQHQRARAKRANSLGLAALGGGAAALAFGVSWAL